MANAPEKKKNAPPEQTPDDALNSFLNRSQDSKTDDKAPLKKPKLSRGVIALIIGVIVVAALIIAVVIIANRPITADENSAPPIVPAELATTIDEHGEHHVEVGTDENGEIKQNGYGELLSYIPAEIAKIEVENTDGSFTIHASTPEGEATVYTVTGLEGFDLQPGMADAVANDAATLSFTSVAAVGGTLADFGLSKPRATVKVTYTDSTSATIRVGNEADGGAGTYITLGNDDDIFLAADDAVDSFLYSALDLVSLDITPAAETVEDNEFSVIELSGTRYDDPITLVPNTDVAIKANYRLTSPYEMFADNYEGNDISGSIRDLYAESVVCVNPSDDQLSAYGVAEPYASVYAVYPDIEIALSCSAPADDGLVNLYNPAKGVIYTIRVDALGWAKTNLDRLLPKTVIELNKNAVTAITVTSKNKTYTLDVTTTEKSVKNENGDTEQQITTAAKLDGKRIPEDSFNIFFQNFNGMKNLGYVSESGANILYQWLLSYDSGRGDDTIAIYDTGDKSCPVALNGILIGSVSKSYVNSLQQDILDLKNNKIPKSL